MTFGQRIADHVAAFGGSWTFIISFAVFLLVWICINIYWLGNKGFDPYPFIISPFTFLSSSSPDTQMMIIRRVNVIKIATEQSHRNIGREDAVRR
jgi:hypothetical protein